MGIYRGIAAARVSTLVIDRDLDMKLYALKANQIAESTTGHGTNLLQANIASGGLATDLTILTTLAATTVKGSLVQRGATLVSSASVLKDSGLDDSQSAAVTSKTDWVDIPGTIEVNISYDYAGTPMANVNWSWKNNATGYANTVAFALKRNGTVLAPSIVNQDSAITDTAWHAVSTEVAITNGDIYQVCCRRADGNNNTTQTGWRRGTANMFSISGTASHGAMTYEDPTWS